MGAIWDVLHEGWPYVAGAGVAIAGAGAFIKNALEVRKLRDEHRLRVRQQGVILIATPEEVERYGKQMHAAESRMRIGGALAIAAIAGLSVLNVLQMRPADGPIVSAGTPPAVLATAEPSKASAPPQESRAAPDKEGAYFMAMRWVDLMLSGAEREAAALQTNPQVGGGLPLDQGLKKTGSTHVYLDREAASHQDPYWVANVHVILVDRHDRWWDLIVHLEFHVNEWKVSSFEIRQ